MALSILGVGGSSLQSDGSSWVQSTSVTCTPTYSFLPCTTELWGQLFLILVYNLLTSVGSSYVSKGSELFFRMFGTGVLGASVFQILGTVPQMVIMLASILPSDSDTVETMAAMIMAMLAGSTIFSLTIVWSSVIFFGSRHISNSRSNSGSYHGVMTDRNTKHVAGHLLFMPVIPILTFQVGGFLSSSTAKRWFILAALIIALIELIVYILFQVFKPLIQDRSYEYVVRKTMERRLLQCLISSGKPNEAAIRALFRKNDANHDGKITSDELYAFLSWIRIEVGFTTDEFSMEVMRQFDTSGDDTISETEFMTGISKWFRSAGVHVDDLPSSSSTTSEPNPSTSRQVFEPLIKDRSYQYFVRKTMERGRLHCLICSGKPNEAAIRALFREIDNNKDGKITSDELNAFFWGIRIKFGSGNAMISETEFTIGISKWLNESEPNPSTSRQGDEESQSADEIENFLNNPQSADLWWNYTRSAFMILFGIGIMLLIGMPLMISISSFATAVNLPSSFTAYVVIPLFMGYRQLIAAIHTATKGTVKDISLALSQIYNGVFMNNLVSLVLFLILVYVKDISWDVSSEVLMVLLISSVMGLISCLKNQFSIGIGILAIVLYPVSIAMLYLLTEVLGL